MSIYACPRRANLSQLAPFIPAHGLGFTGIPDHPCLPSTGRVVSSYLGYLLRVVVVVIDVVVLVAVAAVPPPPDAAGAIAHPPTLKALKAGISLSTSLSTAPCQQLMVQVAQSVAGALVQKL